MNNTRDGEIDTFHRRLLCYAINIRHPRHIPNEAFYQLTIAIPWSKIIAYHHLSSWFGHMMRLPVGTPVRRALAQAETPVKMPRGRPKTAWLGCMKEHIKSIGLTWEGAKSMVGDLIGWRDRVLGCLRPQSA